MSALRIWRARPLLGTVVTIQLLAHDAAPAHLAIASAFQVIEKIQSLMSAHLPSSDLGRLSRAASGDTLRIHPWTHEVIGLAQHWFTRSCGAFDPCLAARRLHRPGLVAQPQGDLTDLTLLPDAMVLLEQPVMLDLGGIAKGYAVDKAVAHLQALGWPQGVVDAGGDMRAWGSPIAKCEIRHADLTPRGLRIKRHLGLRDQAVATSAASPINPEFVRSLPRRRTWGSATVLAPDCVTADVLTKWALQSSLLCPDLRHILRQHKATMWRRQ